VAKKAPKPTTKPKADLFGDDDDDFAIKKPAAKEGAKNKRKLFDDSD
jgi:hypothetical protein